MELQECVAGRWSPQIGDPDVTGWLTVLAYVLTAILSIAVWRRLAGRAGRVFWAVLVVVLAFLAVNKQLDLQSALTAAGKCLATAQGWYAERRAIQAGFIATLLATVVLGLVATMLMLRNSLGRDLLALLGLGIVLAFVMVRAVSIHRFDYLIGAQSLGVSNNFLFENAGLLLIALNAVLLLRRYRGSGPGANRP
ncbi:hypothetical protein FA740_00605 [Paracoccus hibiscisoli]|uniref:Uncharacterized protein n=1 Tax=Paracoccus hibiscisoli TaxID=2023261 RepID=A0A4U0R162_9RHOB|nr:hypothetical protein FA740_00605 [Paracoccus hibiscisoli]